MPDYHYIVTRNNLVLWYPRCPASMKPIGSRMEKEHKKSRLQKCRHCHVETKLTILGGRARSAALPFLVRRRTMFFKIFCFSNSIALFPRNWFPYNCIGVATYLQGSRVTTQVSTIISVNKSTYKEITREKNNKWQTHFIPPTKMSDWIMRAFWTLCWGTASGSQVCNMYYNRNI